MLIKMVSVHFSKNDVISSVRKHNFVFRSELRLELGLGLAEKPFLVKRVFE